MEKIKLYTEEQLKRCFNDAQMQWANYRFMYQDFDEYKIACNPQPIELPSDEEIDKGASDVFLFGADQGKFIAGAKWVIEQIKKQADGR